MNRLEAVTTLICRVYDSEEVVSVHIDGGGAQVMRKENSERSPSLLLAPAFLDLQINGYGGVDFSNASELAPDDLLEVAHALWRQGVAYFLPTVITGSFDSTYCSLEILAAGCRIPLVAASIPGLHLEGPYISSEDGPRGAHPKEHVRLPSWDEFSQWQEAAGGMIKLVTLAPELPGAIEFIEKLCQTGVLAAIGHTSADSRAITDAVAAGASLSTHLGNAAHAHIKRHPNYIWDQLASDQLFASLIVDGHHLPPAVVKAMVRAKGAERCVLVSDAAPVASLPAGEYRFAGTKVHLTPKGRVELSGTDYLAGSALQLPDAVHNVARFTDIEPRTALEMASRQPCRLLERATSICLDVFTDETFTVLRWNEQGLEVVALMVGGSVRHLNTEQLGD